MAKKIPASNTGLVKPAETTTTLTGYVYIQDRDIFRCSCGFGAEITGGRWLEITCPRRRWWNFWAHKSTWTFGGKAEA